MAASTIHMIFGEHQQQQAAMTRITSEDRTLTFIHFLETYTNRNNNSYSLTLTLGLTLTLTIILEFNDLDYGSLGFVPIRKSSPQNV